jgi:hypothetical protein
MSLMLQCEVGGPMNLSVRHHERSLFAGPRARVVFARLGAISVKRRVRALCAVAIDRREERATAHGRVYGGQRATRPSQLRASPSQAALAERIAVVWAANKTCSPCGVK